MNISGRIYRGLDFLALVMIYCDLYTPPGCNDLYPLCYLFSFFLYIGALQYTLIFFYLDYRYQLSLQKITVILKFNFK